MPEQDPHRFRLKGEAAERVLQNLAVRSFLTDWCYPNPTLPAGRELCDLLVVFDQVAIIWQVKNLKLGSDGRYSNNEVKKNIRQLGGARRVLFDLRQPVELRNPRRGAEIFDASPVRDVFLISLLAGEGEEVFSPIDDVKDRTVHVFTAEFAEIALRELDTVSDFVTYLREKERLVSKLPKLVVQGGEGELLAYYLFHEKSFEPLLGADGVILEGGQWSRLQARPEYRAKQEANKISYGWDSMIDRAHEGGHLRYERIAREMARPNRFERRYLAKVFFDAYQKAHNDGVHDVLRRVLPMDGRTYCFMFAEDYTKAADPREFRRQQLGALCYVARGKYPANRVVIGIGTEKRIEEESSFDFCLLDMPEWTSADEERVARLQDATGILTDLTYGQSREDEYPGTRMPEDAG